MSNTNSTYKQTPIGLIPSDWEVKPLGNYVKVSSGESPILFNLSNKNGKYPYLKVEDLNNCDKYQSFSREYSNDEKSIIEKNSIIFPKRGAAILNNKVRINKVPIQMDSNLMALTPINQILTSEYLYYTIIKVQLFKIADTSTIPQINNKHILPFKIAIPPLPEQQKIAAILSTWDTAIDNCKAIIEKLKERNKGLAQLLLTGKKRVKGFENTKWKIYSLDDITENFSRRNKELVNARIYSVTNNNGFVLQSDHFSREVAGDDLNNYKIIKKNEFAYNPARINVGSIAYFENEIGIISSLYVCFRSKNQVLDKFLLYWLSIEKTQHDISRYGEGGVRIYLWFELFATIKIELPQIDEQDAILKILDAASAELNQYQEKLEQLQLQKKGLMQQLLTGKIRVNVN